MILRPIKLTAPLKDYIWGGTKLITEYKKETTLSKVAESWELSTHKDGESIVADGEFKGMTLLEYIDKNGKACIGTKALAFDYFPVLIKLIDATDKLSVQVHPSDEYALKNEGGYGKTEVWYVLDCEKDAFLYYGVNREISKNEFEDRIKNNTLLDVLNKVNVKKGDVFFIEAGTIHAIGKGIVICEVQQNSNITYRIYDYDRRDKNGNARELHIEKALEVAKLTPSEKYVPEGNIFAKCKYFTAERLVFNGEGEITVSDESFMSLIITEGYGKINLGEYEIEFTKGDSIFIPAQNATAKVSGDCEIIASYV